MRKVLVFFFIILILGTFIQNVSCQDTDEQKQQLKIKKEQQKELREKQLRESEQLRQKQKIEREARRQELREEREKSMKKMEEEFQQRMKDLDDKINGSLNEDIMQIQRDGDFFNAEIIDEEKDQQQEENNKSRRNLENDWKKNRDREFEREREREKKRRERMKNMDSLEDDDVFNKEEFDKERRERRERREERRREKEERRAKFGSRGSESYGNMKDLDEEEHYPHDIEDMMDDMELRDRMHIKENEFSRRHKTGKNDQEGKESRNIIISGQEEYTYPVLSYIHSGKSQYNWNIEYNRRSRKDDINIVFGDSRFERLQNSQKYMYNYIWGHEAYTDKFKLTENLRKLDKSKKYNLVSDEFHPQSYLINMQYRDYSEQELDFLDVAEDCNHLWIEKPNNSAGSTGIKLHKKIDRFIKSMKLRKERARKQNASESTESEMKFDKFRSVTIQEYVENPLIVNQKKCDLTHHVLTLYTGKNWLYYVYNSPNARCAQEEYRKGSINNNKIHTTNLEKVENEYYYLEDDEFEELANQHSFTEKQYWQLVQKQYKKSDSDIQNLKSKIDDVIIYSFEAGQKEINPEKGFYHLWSVDIMIDENFNPWIFDIDYFPNLKPKTPAKKEAMSNLGQGLIDILTKLNDNWDKMDEIVKNNNFVDQDSFRLVYNSASKFNPLEKYLKTQKGKQDDL